MRMQLRRDMFIADGAVIHKQYLVCGFAFDNLK